HYNDARLAPPESGKGEEFQVTAGVSALREGPGDDARMVTQALHGETLTLYQEHGFYGLVRKADDGYVGWVDLETIAAPALPPTHRVSALRTYVFSEPDLKSAPHYLCSLNSRVVAEDSQDKFIRCARAGWIFAGHLVELGVYEDDPAAVAERFEGCPYLWGGRESLGLDCTGLTQTAFEACGVMLPRDSDMQAEWSGVDIENWTAPGTLQRGDLVFWNGHVGLMLDGTRIIHANAHHMACAIEPLTEAIERIGSLYGQPTRAKRIDLDIEQTAAWRSAISDLSD
ncbi:MAG: NlpC/P60 family protein, partial [Pseudomonadota bacterium]